MGKIDLGREQGVRVTGAAGHGGTNVNYGQAIGAVGQVGNAIENASRGIKHVSDSLFGIYNDLADSRNRQEFLEGQTAMFDFASAENEKLEERMRKGEFDRAGGVELFKQAALQAQEKIKAQFADWSSKNITQIDTRKALNEHLALDSKRNFAHMSGRFLAYDQERRFNLMKSQCDRAVEEGSMENLLAAINAYCGGGKDKDGNELPRYKSQEFKDNLINEYTRKLILNRINKELSLISDIQNDKEKMSAIEAQVNVFKEALDGKISDEGLKFLTQQDIIKAKNAFFGLYNKEEINARRKRDVSLAYRLNKFWEADDASLAEREKNLYKFVNENPAFSAEEKAEARAKIRQTVEASRMERKKLADARIKEAILEQKERTNSCILDSSQGKPIEFSQDEKNNIAQIRAAAQKVFGLPDEDENGKITKSIWQKQEGYLWKLADAISAYDRKTDTDGSYARALYYQLEAVFDDSTSELFVSEDDGKKIGDVLSLGANLIHEPETKKRLMRELGQRCGVYPDANIKISDVRRLLDPMIETVLNKRPNELKAHQRGFLKEIEMGFENAAMTAGLDSPEELANWFKTSPYVASFKERLKLLKKLGEEDAFDTSFSHVDASIRTSPKLYPQGGNVFEEMYLKLKQNKNSEE